MGFYEIEKKVEILINELLNDDGVDIFFKQEAYSLSVLVFKSLSLLNEKITLNQLKNNMKKEKLIELKNKVFALKGVEMQPEEFDRFILRNQDYQKRVYSSFNYALSRLGKERLNRIII